MHMLLGGGVMDKPHFLASQDIPEQIMRIYTTNLQSTNQTTSQIAEM